MQEPFYGRCDTCAATLASRYHSFSRQIEECEYSLSSESNAQPLLVNILHSDQLTQYCGVECAEIGAYVQLEDRGIPLNIVSPGPIAPCSKCGSPMDLRQAHVAYELMDHTEIRQPWLISVKPHDSRTVARLCKKCDGNWETYAETDTSHELKNCLTTS